MNDSPPPGFPPQAGGGTSSASSDPLQANPDPAYAGSAPPGPSYSAVLPSGPAPTAPLPQYWTQTYPQTAPLAPSADVPPEQPRGPGPWLWGVAGFAVVGVIALVIWLVFVVFDNTNPSTQATSIPATSSTTVTPRTPTTTRAAPTVPPIPIPSLPFPTAPSTDNSGEMEPVVYDVTGQGRAFSIVYIDTGGMMQFEFNVLLPWHKEVDLPKPAKDSASITATNSGNNITCTITIGGVQVRESTGALLTACLPMG